MSLFLSLIHSCSFHFLKEDIDEDDYIRAHAIYDYDPAENDEIALGYTPFNSIVYLLSIRTFFIHLVLN